MIGSRIILFNSSGSEFKTTINIENPNASYIAIAFRSYNDASVAIYTPIQDEISNFKATLNGVAGNITEPLCVSPISISFELNTSTSVDPSTGGNSGTGCRTGYLRYYNPLCVSFDNENYLISAWNYTTNGVPGAHAGFTGGVYLNGKNRKIYIPSIPDDESTYFRLGFKKTDGSAMTSDDTAAISSALSFFELTDKTLTMANVPADSKAVGDALASVETQAENTEEKLNSITGRYNLFDKDDADIVEGQFISSVSEGAATWTTNANFGESGFIPVTPGQKITFYVPGNESPSALYRVYYDSTKDTVTSGGGTMPSNGYITVPNDVAYMRVAFSLIRKSTFMVITLNDDDTIPFSPANEVYAPYKGFTFPYIAKTLDAAISSIALPGEQWKGKSWFAFGTSITETDNAAHTGKYVPYLVAMSGMVVTNRGHGGQGIGDFGATSTGTNYESICKLTDGKANADLITLEQGANDVSAAVPLGSIYDTGRTTSLAGCLNDCIRYLLANTHAQIVIMNSPYSKTMPTLENKIFEWREMMREICFLNGVYFIDTSCGLGTARVASEQGSNYLVDNIHQTELGGYIFAENIWYKLRNIPLFRTSIPT